MGLYTASVLEKLEETLGAPIASRFDLIAGTSIGGIIALGLASGLPAKKIREAFQAHGSSIFTNKPPAQGMRALREMLGSANRAKYRQENLKAAISEMVNPTLRIGDLKRPVLIPTVNLTTGKPQMFKTPHHDTLVRDKHLMVVDVALATSAAPTYFPLAQIGDSLYADGGMYANSPDLMAFHEAKKFLGTKEEDIRVLSIGSTSSNFSFSHSGGTDLGWMQWMKDARLPSVMIASQQFIADILMQHTMGDRYFRIDTAQSPEQERSIGLDVASEAATRDLLALAEAAVQAALPKPFVKEILQHEVPDINFK